MNSLKKLPKGQLQDGLVDMQQLTPVTLFFTGWSLVSGLYEYTYINPAILSTSIVDIIPNNESISIVAAASILPATASSDGSVKIYSTSAPTSNIIVTLNIYNNTDQSVLYESDWVRPGDWLQMPIIGTQEFIGLLAITDDEANHIALTCAGNYTVDWGDGIIENVATGVKAQHTYTYSSISNLTISSRGYKQVIVRVTPQVGQNLTRVDLQQQNSIIAKSYGTGWLDISVNGANITTLTLGGSTVRNSMCERVIIGSIGVITNFSSFFSTCHSLQSVSLFNTSAGTNFSGMFGNCHSLQSVPFFDTSAGTNFSSMFVSCFSLKEVPLFNTAVGTNFNSMFQSCASLKTIPLINTALGTTFSNMFTGCLSLQTVPLLNLSSAITLTNMFVQCYSIQTIPLFNTASATAFNGMFSTCVSLQSVPLLNTASGSTFANMFTDCSSLQLLPNFNTAAGTNFGAIFNTASLAKGAFQGTRYSIAYQNMCLSQSAIVDIFNGLGTAVGTPTITVSGNPGYAALTAAERLIATNKGFTIA